MLRTVHMDSHTRSDQVERLEVVETGRRRRWSEDEKLKIVLESLQAPRLGDGGLSRYMLACCLVKGKSRSSLCGPIREICSDLLTGGCQEIPLPNRSSWGLPRMKAFLTMTLSRFLAALGSEVLPAHRAKDMDVYEWLIGSWEMSTIHHLDNGTIQGSTGATISAGCSCNSGGLDQAQTLDLLSNDLIFELSQSRKSNIQEIVASYPRANDWMAQGCPGQSRFRVGDCVRSNAPRCAGRSSDHCGS
jgi:hypothetical protein